MKQGKHYFESEEEKEHYVESVEKENWEPGLDEISRWYDIVNERIREDARYLEKLRNNT